MFGRFWIKRSEWEEVIRKAATVDVLKEQITAFNGLLKLAASRERQLEDKCDELRARVTELEEAVVKTNDELVITKRAQVGPTRPVTLDTLFAEDEEAVRQDREYFKQHGTTDPLLAGEPD